jgi:hypothetical protein
MDMEVFKMVVTMLVAKGHGVEREREREVLLAVEMRGGWFFRRFWTQISPHLDHENQIYL